MESSPSSQGKHLRWEDLEGAAKSMFNVWVDQPELRWGKEAWERLLQSGLGNYRNPLEKCAAKIRFLALAGFYRDFCCMAWGEAATPNYAMWAELLEIDEFSLGQLVGTDTDLCAEDEYGNRANAVLRKLIRSARPVIVNKLEMAYGNNGSLFVSLWNSTKYHSRDNCEDGGCDDCEETADEILDYNIDEKGPAWTWLDQGAPECLEQG